MDFYAGREQEEFLGATEQTSFKWCTSEPPSHCKQFAPFHLFTALNPYFCLLPGGSLGIQPPEQEILEGVATWSQCPFWSFVVRCDNNSENDTVSSGLPSIQTQ